MALALILRLAAIDPFSAHHPDELYQYLEQANRLITGDGIVPWEYRAGMRSWLVPVLFAGPMWLGHAIAPGGDLDLILPRVLAALIGLVPVWAAWTIGARHGRGAAIFAALVVATWYESVLFSTHLLTEPLAVAAMLAGAALADDRASSRRWMPAGAALALAAVLRIHYAPAIAAFALIVAGRRPDRRLALAIGGAAVALASGAIDLIAGQIPFGWVIENFRQNIVHNRAAGFGVEGPGFYPYAIGVMWGAFVVPIAALALIAARREPALAIAALVNFAVHSAIGHKEYRFIWLTVQIMLLLAAIGSAWFASRFARRQPAHARLRRGVIALLWLIASVGLARNHMAAFNGASNRPALLLVRAAGKQPALCGIAVERVEYWTAGHAMLARAAPIYFPVPFPGDHGDPLAAASPAYNFIVASPKRGLPAYHPLQCAAGGGTRLCLYRRAGGCEAAAGRPVLMQQVLERKGL